MTFCSKLTDSFRKRGYTKNNLTTHIERANSIPRETTLVQTPRAQNNRLTFITTYNRTNPDIKDVLQKHWHLLQLDSNLGTIFSELPMIAFKRNKNLGDILGSKNLSNSKVVRYKRSYTIKRCKPCTENISKKCCKQLKDTNSFKSTITGKEYKIFHDCNCLSKNLIYLMECSICNKQYVGKTQTTLERRINGHRSDVKCKNEPIAADKHFRLAGHEFDRDAKFTIIEQAINKRDKSEMATFLMSIEDTWILRLKTLATQGLNDQLNFSAQSTGVLSL